MASARNIISVQNQKNVLYLVMILVMNVMAKKVSYVQNVLMAMVLMLNIALNVLKIVNYVVRVNAINVIIL